MALVLLDVGIDGFDLLPDVAGWLLAAVALGRLRHAMPAGAATRRCTAAGVLAWAAAVLGVAVVEVPALLHVSGVVAAGQPVVAALALLTFAGARVPHLRRTWLTTVVALSAAALVVQGAVALAATAAGEDADAVGVLAAVGFVVAHVVYLVAIQRTRVALRSPRADEGVPGALPGRRGPRLGWAAGVVVAATAAVAPWTLQRDGEDPWRAATGGRATAPIAAFDLADGRYEFRAYLDDSGAPSIVYFIPGHGGGSRLVAVGERGGWAIEPRVVRAGDRDVVYGATIAEASTVRVRAGGVVTTAATVHVTPGGVRYFAVVTAPGTHVRRTHDVTAHDGDGNLLGRAHDNYGAPDRPDIGAYDGLWDREHAPPGDVTAAGLRRKVAGTSATKGPPRPPPALGSEAPL